MLQLQKQRKSKAKTTWTTGKLRKSLTTAHVEDPRNPHCTPL